jgi:hypothetical protein
MPLIDTIAKQIAAGFKGKLNVATLRRDVPNDGVDDLGDPLPAFHREYGFEGIIDTYSQLYKAQAGIPDTDVRILVIAGTLSTVPLRGDQVLIKGGWYQVREVSKDPADATYTLQSYGIGDPTQQGMAP